MMLGLEGLNTGSAMESEGEVNASSHNLLQKPCKASVRPECDSKCNTKLAGR